MVKIVRKNASIDNTQKYRYWLLREWDVTLPKMVFVMLNPSTADANIDDPTIKRCISFAKDSGYGSIQVVNLFAFRATDPKEIKNKEIDPIGEKNNTYILRTCKDADLVIAAWGENGKFKSRNAFVESLICKEGIDLYCLGLTKEGYPRHPLFVRGDVQPTLYKEKKIFEVISVVPTVSKKIQGREGIDPLTLDDYDFHRDVMDG